jgi:hypothetical protein
MVVTMNPFMTEQRGFILNESSCAESAAQFFVCEQTNRINGRRTSTTTRGNSAGALSSPPRLPGGRDILFARDDRGVTRSRLPLFTISLSVVATLLRSPTEVRRQTESPSGSLFLRPTRRS